MIRLFTIKAAIVTLKSVIAISRKLKPRTWACLAVTQTIFAALCFWGYHQQSHQQYVQVQEEGATPAYNVGSDTYISAEIDSRAVSLTTSKIDDEQFFIREQYVDFLGRELDTSGLIFWSDATNSGTARAALNSLAMRHDLIGFSAHGWNTNSSASGVSLNLEGHNCYVESDKARSTKLVTGRAKKQENRRVQNSALAVRTRRAYYVGNRLNLLSPMQRNELRSRLECLLKERETIAFLNTVQKAEGGREFLVVGGLPGESAHTQGRGYNLNLNGLASEHGLPNRRFFTTCKYGLSTAAGSYQIVYNQNWKGVHRPLSSRDFSEENQGIAALELSRVREQPPSLPTISGYNWNTTPKASQPFSGTILGTGFVSGGSQVWFCLSGTSTCYRQPATGVIANNSTSLSVSNVNLSSGSWGEYVPTLQPHVSTLGLVEDTRFSIGAIAGSGLRSDSLPDWFYRRLPQFQPTFVSPSSSSGSTSLLDMLQKLMLLFQAIVLTIGSAFASAFGVVSYYRGKADLKLKRLQIREMEIKLENMERERNQALQEAARSSIILLS